MKSLLIKPSNHWLLACAACCAAGMVTAHASSSLITFSVDMSVQIGDATFVPGTDTVSVHGTLDGWGAGVNLVQEGSSTVYTNTFNDTSDANAGQVQYKFVDSNAGIPNGGYESLPTGQNRASLLPATSGASLVLATPFFNDAGTPVTNNVTFQVDVSQQIALGTFVNDGSYYVDVRGLFNNWTGGIDILTNDPSILVTNQNGLVTSNVWVGSFPIAASPGATEGFKYVIMPTTLWESPSPVNSDGGGNRFFANEPQTLPIVNFSDEPFAPLCSVTFAVDMSAQALSGAWPLDNPVDLAGSFNNWNTFNTPMTNDPNASNPNIYYAVVGLGAGSTPQYKFTFQGNAGTIWENPGPPTLGGNRFFVVPQLASTNLPVMYFSDTTLSSLLNTDVWVTFSVNMAGASQYPSGPAFDPGSDTVFVNSPAFTGAWVPWDATDLAAYQLTEVGTSTIYTNTILIPQGNAVNVTYKYGIDGLDNEAASGSNHARYIRTTATGAYTLPTDTFGNQYGEPAFGELGVGPASGGNVQLSWLGAPNVQVQTSSNLDTSAWVSHPETSGTVWSSGVASTNGLISVTNWPAGGKNLYFRLIQQ